MTHPAPSSDRPAEAEIELSVVVPVYGEADNIGPLCARLLPLLRRVVTSYEVLFVDDGSPDDTLAAIRRQNVDDPNVVAVSFSRNFGKEVAIAAGLDHARGKAVVIMDADLQHPPETIEAFVEQWRQGYAMVYGQRTDRSGESRVKRGFTHVFYRLFARFGETELPEGAGDFRLIDRRGVQVLKSLGERARFSKGLYAWIGFRATGVPFVVEERAFGTTKWSFRRLFRFAFDGITSFSTVPLRVWTYIGGLVSLGALAAAIWFAFRTLIFGSDVAGYPSLIVSITFFSGIQLLSLGMIGEYVGRIFAEVKRRPLYVVGETVGLSQLAAPLIRDDRRNPGV
ncbi:glycosyltransferase family 2 protein [Enterovirga rhinocerotis]|uniref:Glycosyltransferase involved in cell wall biosynthesis n=1 Tax=Enterovirga rhinocerotis TaxID=1339210 RepID=A0A4R7BT59_9HYPH|nr:glycosyltransferase family 2 protein [Enterovirga rhinocerotis]TDR88934.1 glycosyltransferase involved in cell wall biosynthesis [Enterovirga rhinocerotis]